MRFLLRSLILVAALGMAAGLAPSRAQAQSPAANPQGTVADGYRWMAMPGIQQSFPNLGRDYVVLAPPTGPGPGGYNCISWTVGVTDHWIWPGDTVSSFNRLYAGYGYRRLPAMNFTPQSGVNKITLYAKSGSGGQPEVTHASKQSHSGGWTSKLGQGPVIWHPSPYSVAGPAYGQPIAVYARPRAATYGRLRR